MKKWTVQASNNQQDDFIQKEQTNIELSGHNEELGQDKDNCIYRCKPNYIMREIAGESVLVSVGNGVADFCGIVKLNDSAKVIWSALQNGTSQEELIQALVNTFHITENQAKKDVAQSLELLYNKRMIICE